MPEIGEVKWGRDIGRLRVPSNRFIWQACELCGKERWVRIVRNIPKSTVCSACALHRNGARNGNWKGGRCYQSGYVFVRIPRDDFYAPMCKGSNGRIVQEHRLIMARHLKRCLLPWEVVHHKNGIKDDNRLENLQLLPAQSQHVSDSLLKSHVHRLERRLKILEHRVGLLEAENALLKERGAKNE